MTTYTFEYKDVHSKTESGTSMSGTYSKLYLSVDGVEKPGFLTLETWLQGCGLNGLQRFGVTSWPVECIPALLKHFAKTTSPNPKGDTLKPRRFLFSLTGTQLEYAFIKEFVKHAELLAKVPNLAHGPEDLHIYLLTTK